MGSFNEEFLVERGLTTAAWNAKLHVLQSDASVYELKLCVDDVVNPELLRIRAEVFGQCLEKLQTPRVSSTSAYLSEIVSGLKRNPNLKINTLYIDSLMRSSDAICISEIIRRTTELRVLKFSVFESEGLSEEAVGSLASSIAGAIQHNLYLLEFHTKGQFELLRKIFPAETDSGRRYLPELSLKYIFPEECWELFPVLAGSNISVISIEHENDEAPHPSSLSWWKAFADALKSSPVMCIAVGVRYYRRDSCNISVHAERRSMFTGSLTVIQDCRDIAVMKFSYASLLQDCQIEFFLQLLVDNLRSSISITKLRFEGPRRREVSFSKRLCQGVFQSLKSNTSVTSLDLSGCNLTDVEFEHLMRLLRVNFTVEEVILELPSWRNDGRATLIEEALARNKKQAIEFSILKGAGFEFDKAKVGRIFLCGSPYAGKTQLKLRMMRLRARRSRSASKPGKFSDAFLERLKMLELRRTKGAEVEVLLDNEERQVSLWDLAGQYIFRALHDLIFPRTNQSLIFIFAFNPLREDSKKDMKKNVYDAFALELEEWLKFVASNCPTGDKENLPHILVVITHRDLTDKYSKSFECGPGSVVPKIVERFQSTFQGVVKLVTKVYHVNARAQKDVRSFLDDILALMNDWSKLHSVPVVCSDLSSALLARAKSFDALPVWSCSTFYRFCQKYHESLKNASREILSTIASYLHDAGRIIIVPESSGSKNDEPLIIVDPNWCTEAFLGNLIAVGNHFNVRGESCSVSTVLIASSDGFIDEQDFQALLEQTLHLMKDEGTERTLLEDLLQRLNLCYRFEDGVSCRYFVPVICGGLEAKCDLRERELQWDGDHTEGCQYLGYRLECKDTRTTSFNKGVFSRFQINFRRKLMKKFGIKEMDRGISCGLGLLKVMYDGYEVLVESDEGNGQHVDIMVKSSQPGVKNPRTRMQIISFLQERFLRKLQKFFASSSGCPGISLVVGVIRTSSVRNLVPIRERRAPQHSIALEEWKNKLRLSIDLKLQDMGVDVDEESLLNFHHRWPDGELELVKDSLGSEDLTDILSYIRGKITRSNESHQMPTILSGPEITCAGADVALSETPGPAKELFPRGLLPHNIAQYHECSQSADPSRKGADEVKKLSDEVYEIYRPFNGCPRLEVVFFHGVPEDESDLKPYLTMWSKRNEEPDRCWINTWLTSATEDLRLGRVFTVSYDCGVEKRAHNGNMDSFQVAENLAQSLIKWAGVGQQSCPVILVGHCLGGLVIKELCCEASRNVEAQKHHAVECLDFLKNVKGIFYYSTPHLGWSQSFSSEVQTGDMMECLQVLNKYASRVNFQFEQLRRIYGWTTRGVGESNPTKLFLSTEGDSAMKKLIVEEASARGGCLDGFSVLPDTDHFSF
ncbi:hypothetical protein R1sor_021927 [Riccia sorocarpa]|uniref:Uncharacterized protein n=1 Tax=Riccia sorocarpa TaxID=122646 RepID=A0ABD3GM75_9MARC